MHLLISLVDYFTPASRKTVLKTSDVTGSYVLIDLFRQTDAVIVQHLSDDKIEVGDADDTGDEDPDEEARPDLREAGHVVGRQVAEHEGGAN